jgi:hypothetical protein
MGTPYGRGVGLGVGAGVVEGARLTQIEPGLPGWPVHFRDPVQGEP